jgi:competence protein ComEA
MPDRIILALLVCALAAPAMASTAMAPEPAAPAEVRLKPERKRHGKPPMAGVLNVNRASEAELRLLPGIGKGRAAAIIERRSKRPFASLDEIARLKGMKAVVHRLRGQLVVQGNTTLHPVRP